jgi:hypothetical protein
MIVFQVRCSKCRAVGGETETTDVPHRWTDVDNRSDKIRAELKKLGWMCLQSGLDLCPKCRPPEARQLTLGKKA